VKKQLMDDSYFFSSLPAISTNFSIFIFTNIDEVLLGISQQPDVKNRIFQCIEHDASFIKTETHHLEETLEIDYPIDIFLGSSYYSSLRSYIHLQYLCIPKNCLNPHFDSHMSLDGFKISMSINLHNLYLYSK